MSQVYLRDLSDVYREEVEKEIRAKRPDLAKTLDFNNTDECESEIDIVVGTLLKPEEYSKV